MHFCGTAEHQLENFLKIKGLILSSFVVPELALHQGRCEMASRSVAEVGETVLRTVRGLGRQRGRNAM